MLIDSDYDIMFSDKVWIRAQRYAQQKRVAYLGVNRAGKGEERERHFFSISGTDNSEYTVTIQPGRYRGDITARCTCPYDRDGYCKHVGAAIITGIGDGIFSLTDYYGERTARPAHEERFGSKSPKAIQESTKELRFDLSKLLSTKSARKIPPSDVLEVPYSFRRETLFPEPPVLPAKDAKAPREYLLVFFVEYDYSGLYNFGNPATRDPLKVSPGARFIKLDGAPGRYEPYRDNQIFKSITDYERNLLTWLLDSESKSVPFGYVLPHLVRDPNLRIVMRRSNTHVPVSIEELRRVRVSFVFGALQSDNAPLFHPQLAFESGEIQSDSGGDLVPIDAVTYGESGIGLYFVTKADSIIYYTKNESLDARYLTRILKRQGTYTIDDILSISESIISPFLKVDPPKGKVLIKLVQPELTLYLETRDRGIIVHPAFVYGTRTIERDETAPLLTDIRVDDTLYVHRRDFNMEKRLLDWFRDLVADSNRSFVPYALQIDVPEFLFRYGEACVDAGVRLFLKGDNKPIKRSGSFNIVASSGIDWLDLKIRIDDRDVSPGDIDLLRGTVAVDGAYQLIDPETLERLRALYEAGNQGRASLQLSRFDLATISQIESLMVAEDDFDLTRIRSALAKLDRGFDAKRLRRPEGMVGILRPYQKSGVKWLQFLSEFGFGGILADDMGLGKTIQAITLLAHLAEQGVEGPYLVIAPVSTIPNWVREVERFSPKMPVYPHIGPERPANSEDVASYRGVVVTSYHTLQRDIELFEPLTWSQLILDESQALKNPTAKTHKTVRRLSFDRVLAMSGTPVENNIQELWSVMSILNPGLLGTKTDFMKRFRKRIADGDENAIETLRVKLRPFLLRRTKEQVAADLPTKEEVSIDVSHSPAERKFYNALKEKLRDEVRNVLVSDEPFRAANMILTALTKLRQAAIAPSLVGGPSQSSKLDAVIEKLDESVSEGHKILVFSQYVRILRMLKTRVEQHGWTYRYLDGSTSTKKRKTIIDEFQNDPGVNVFLISLKAGGVGINLTEADYVFLVDPWWNPAVESQAIDRTHRIGQTKPVFAYRFISTDTIEQRILELQETKRELVRNVIGEATSIFKSLSKDEIIGLFE